MKKEDLIKLKQKLEELSDKEKKLRDLYLKRLANGELQGPMVGYPSVDKPWLANYTDENILLDLPKMNIYSYMKLCNENRMDSIAIDYEFVSITYREMFQKIDEVASTLLSMGIKKGDTIASCLPNIPEAIYLIYAAAKLGVTIDEIDALTSKDLLYKYCELSKPKMIFVLDLMSSNAIKNLDIPTYEKVVAVSPLDSLPGLNENPETSKNVEFSEKVISWQEFIRNNQNINLDEISFKPDMPFAILHTGGTTGIPKGALILHDNMNSLAHQMINSPLNLTPGESALSLMPPFASYGLGNGIHVHLCAGIRIRLIPSYDPSKTAEQLIEYKPNRVAFTPAHVESLINDPRINNIDLSFLHYPIVGGDTLALKTELKINEILLKNGCKDKIAKGYGLTETCSGVCFTVSNNVNELQSVGISLVKNVLAVIDFKDGNLELPYSEVGEIAVNSANNMLEYLNMPEETAATIKKHVDGSVWLHTGDIGRIDEKGRVFILGRMRRMIIQYSGLKSNPFEAEETLIKHPLVKRAVVVGAKDRNHNQGELPVAYIQVSSEDLDKEEILKAELHRMCEENITYYSVPVDYVFVDKLPETKRGKIDYRALSDHYNQNLSSRKLILQRQLKI